MKAFFLPPLVPAGGMLGGTEGTLQCRAGKPDRALLLVAPMWPDKHRLQHMAGPRSRGRPGRIHAGQDLSGVPAS